MSEYRYSASDFVTSLSKLLVILSGGFCFFYAFKIEPYRLKVSEYTLNSKKENTEALKIVQFSDLHIKKNFTCENLKKAVQKINEQNPDIVVFTGDLYDNYATYHDDENIIEQLSNIKAKYEKIAIWGNRDYGGGVVRQYESVMTQSGFILLENENWYVTTGNDKKILFTGLDDSMLGNPYIPDSTKIYDSACNILLTHEPDTVEAYLDYGYNIALSGHSHGGQIDIPFFPRINQMALSATSLATEYSGSLSEKVSQGADIQEAVTQTEDSNKVIVVRIEQFTKKENETINDEIRLSFQENGIGFQRYWLWDGEVCRRLYTQEKLNYSLLVEYRQIDSSLYVVTMIIPNISDAFGIINIFLVGANVVSIMISILAIIVLIRKIVKPLSEFKMFALRMENNQFIPLQVQTKDELENVADSLNSMGRRIMDYQVSLHEKNQEMADMVNRLLYLSRIDKKEYEKAQINLSDLLGQLVDKYSAMAEKNHLRISAFLEKGIFITASEELLTSLFTNLVTNAIKYSSDKKIFIELLKKEKQSIITFSNETDNNALDVSKIWEPYYVGEKSRNKNLSGTGLGLSIVHKICETQHYEVDCSLRDKKIIFTVTIPL